MELRLNADVRGDVAGRLARQPDGSVAFCYLDPYRQGGGQVVASVGFDERRTRDLAKDLRYRCRQLSRGR